MRPDAFYVPLKDFARAKERLRAVDGLNVADLARRLATGVIVACSPVPVIVVTESDDVEGFARRLGADVFRSPASGLNDALGLAYRAAAPGLVVAIVPGDLAAPAGLGEVDVSPGATIVVDRHGRGTNLLAIPTGLDVEFHFGPDSARRHEVEARRLGLGVAVILDSPWALDVDQPDDLTTPRG
ncbi:MAG: hypothetical protein ACRDV0_03720 [Acidimicrobiales bacterium]